MNNPKKGDIIKYMAKSKKLGAVVEDGHKIISVRVSEKFKKSGAEKVYYIEITHQDGTKGFYQPDNLVLVGSEFKSAAELLKEYDKKES